MSVDLRMQLVCKLGYLGAPFSGFAAQEGQTTVQGELEYALSTLLHRDAPLTCAGRTDAGVNAQAQVINTPVTLREMARFSEFKLTCALNSLTHDAIVVTHAYLAPQDFSARFDALSRKYVYRVANPAPPVLSSAYAAYVRGALDVSAMQKAAKSLLGTHDFTSFCKTTSAAEKNCERSLLALDVERVREVGEEHVVFTIEATAFLHNMVRILAGTLLEVGRGKQPYTWPKAVLAAKDRTKAGPTAPAHGLTFAAVRYPSDAFVPFDEAMREAR